MKLVVDAAREAERLGQQPEGVRKVRLHAREQDAMYGHLTPEFLGIEQEVDPSIVTQHEYISDHLCPLYTFVNEESRSETFEAAEAGLIEVMADYYVETAAGFMEETSAAEETMPGAAAAAMGEEMLYGHYHP